MNINLLHKTAFAALISLITGNVLADDANDYTHAGTRQYKVLTINVGTFGATPAVATLRATQDSLWERAFATCAEKGGVIKDYHQGSTDRLLRIGGTPGVQIGAYANCLMDPLPLHAGYTDPTGTPARYQILKIKSRPGDLEQTFHIDVSGGRAAQSLPAARDEAQRVCAVQQRPVEDASYVYVPGGVILGELGILGQVRCGDIFTDASTP